MLRLGALHMKRLFDQIVIGGATEIARLVHERLQETVDLEFKTKSDPSHGRLDRNDKEVLGKILSAFSNSAGGTLIYGILGRPNEEGIDCASGCQPISNLDTFRSEVTRAVGELLMPRSDAIVIHAVPDVQMPESGYLALFIGRSERRPHRSEAKGDKRYYKRAGNSSYMMEHFDIEDAFRRQERARLEIKYSISRGISLSDSRIGILEQDVKIAIELENISNVTARFPYLHILNWSHQLKPDHDGRMIGLRQSINPSTGAFFFDGGADHVINPGVARLACSLLLHLKAAGPERAISSEDIPTLTFEYRMGCEHSPVHRGSVSIDAEEFKTLMSIG